jgi:hypothetical protein
MMKWTNQQSENKMTPSANLPFDREQLMNEDDVDMFIKAFDDFMDHADVEIEKYHQREEVRETLEEKAAELEVTVDYYMQEFM